MKKRLLVILVFFILFLCGCSLFPTNKTESTDFREKIYKLAADSGYEGTYEEWLESIAGDQVELIVDEEGNLKWKYASEKNADYRFLFSMTSLQGTNGEDGNGIEKIELTGSEDLNDTYTITYTNGTTSTFVVKNGAKGDPGHTPEIKIGENGNWYVDDKDTGVASNIKGDTGNGIEKIELSSQEGLKDTYKITFTNGATYTFDVNNGAKGDTGNGITKIELTGDEYPIYTYTVYYTDGSTFAYQVTSGLSAYELYKNAHADYTKTESEFLSDLVNGRLADKETFTVKFNTNCDETIEDIVVNKLDKVSKPSEPKKDGYTFLGWFVEDEKWIFSGCVVTENMTLEAKWQANTYKITYDANGGVVASPSQSILFDNEFILQSPTKDGYRFGGWFYEDALVESGVYKYTKDITITAKWDPLYTIVLNSNGGTSLENIAVTGSRTINSLPTPTRDADRFLGWYFNDELVELPFTYNGENTEIEFVALWKEVAGDYEFIALDDNSLKITKYNGTDTDIIIPNVINGKDVVELETSLFEGNASISKITLQSNIKTIGNNAFANMANLEEVIINPEVTNYGEKLLLNSLNLKKLTITASSTMLMSFYDFDEANIPNGLTVTIIPGDPYVNPNEGIFKNMTENSSINVVLHETWTHVMGFVGCKFLKSIAIPSTVTGIGIGSFAVFSGCINLEAVYIDDISSWLQIAQEDGPLLYAHNLYIKGELVKDLIIPEGVTSIASFALRGCLSLESLTLPSTMTYLGNSCLAGCSNLKYLIIPEGVTKIGNQAFSGCSSISTLVIPESIRNVYSGTFNDMDSLEAVYYKGTRSQWFQYLANCFSQYDDIIIEYESNVESIERMIGEDLSYITTDTGNMHGLHLENTEIVDCNIPEGISVIPFKMFYDCVTLENITLPDSINTIESYAFYGCSSLMDIHIPNSVQKIGDSVFDNCKSLKSLILPETINSVGYFTQSFSNWKNLTSITIPNGVTRIGDAAFAGCTSLTSITIPNSVTSIGNGAFTRCNSLTSIAIPNSVTNISEFAFNECTSLTSITIPNSVTDISGYTFYNCTLLTNIAIPNSVTSIGEYVFYHCYALTSITIPNSVTNLGEHAFHECTSLTSITIPNRVTNIGEYTFLGCTSLTSITIPNSVTSIAASAFANCKKMKDVFYMGNEAEWNAIVIATDNDYLSNASIYFYSENEPVESGNWWYYDTDGTTIIKKVI